MLIKNGINSFKGNTTNDDKPWAWAPTKEENSNEVMGSPGKNVMHYIY